MRTAKREHTSANRACLQIEVLIYYLNVSLRRVNGTTEILIYIS